ncbi:phage minor capsid protein [Limnohabitans sp.]|uniref:structural cement protein Gp24 n=1 Tax=Limnohabitans sp. TaxID=1907725 RepID=UPI00286F6AFD|nr:hypothetical protein [Limnohabitans sp.]
MAFQQAMQQFAAAGFPGQIAFDGPTRARQFILNSAGATPNVVGYAFTMVSEGIARAGGTGAFAGLLSNPLALGSAGTAAGGTLAATLTVADGTRGQLLSMGFMWVMLTNASANIGDVVQFNQTTGALSSKAAGSTADAGNTLIPNCTIDTYTVSAAGLALVKLIN